MKTTYLRRVPIRIIALATILAMLLCLLPAGTREASAATNLRNPRTSGETVTWDCVWFGHYPQTSDGNGGFNNDLIKWRVLSVDGNEALLLADKNLDARAYNEERTSVTWETSTIRSWLNGSGTDSFLGKAFSSAEQGVIYEKMVQNPDNPEYGTAGGNATRDKVFFLSIDEATNPAYGFPSDYGDRSVHPKKRGAVNTDYAKSRGADTKHGGNGYWWLRSPGNYDYSAAAVDAASGSVPHGGVYVNYDAFAVRPALRLNLSSNLWSYAGTVSSDGTEGGKDTTVIPGKIEYATGSYSADDREDTNENRIREAARDFQVKANQYMKEIQAVIKDENKNIAHTEKVTKLQEEDESNKAGKMLSMQETISGPAKEAAYAGVGEFISQYEGSSEALGKIDYSKDIISIAAKIENDIKKAIKTVDITTTYKGYKVTITGTFIQGAFSCGVKVDGKGEHYTGILTSTPKQAANAMAAYLKELNDMVEDVVKQAMAKAVQDFCKRTCITDITEEMLAEHVIEYMNKAGYGKNILNYVMELQKGYELVAELSQLGKVDLNSPDAINKIYDSLKKLSLSDKTVTAEKFAVKEAVKAVEESRERLANMLYNYVYHPDQELDTKRGFLEKAKDWFYKGYKKITGQCPVEFRVYDKAGKQLGYAKDSYCEFDDSIHMEVLGDIKTIYIPDDLDVTIEMEGTDAGSMTYTVEQYKERKAVGRLNYYNVPLTEGSSYSQSLTTGSLSTETTDYPLKSETGAAVDADEYLPAEKNATVKIETSIEGNGTVEGAGTYAKGDCAILIASAGKGYQLEGWYQNDKLVETNSVYHLPALKSSTVKAVFTKNTGDNPSDATTEPTTPPTDPSVPSTDKPTAPTDSTAPSVKPQPLAKGTTLTDTKTKAVYTITKSAQKGAAVTYAKPAQKNAASVAIPAAVTIKGITYKVTAIAPYAFKNCKKLQKVTIGNNIRTVGKGAFSGCSKLKIVTFGKNVTAIGERVFYKDTAMTKVIIPSKVVHIGKQAFYGCKKLKNITVKTTKLTATRVGASAFKGTHPRASVKTPKGKGKTYKKLLQTKGLSKKARVK